MRTILSGGKLVTPTCVLENHTLIFDGEVISAIIPDEQFKPEKKDHQINTPGKWITPGLIDIHVHGSNFADAMDPGSKTYQTLGSFFASRGVTGYLLTTGTASNEDITAVIEAFQDYAPSGDGAVALGIHLEGPYLCEERKGAQPAIHLRDPEPARYQSWFKNGKIRLMTVAPELEGAMDLIKFGVKQGVEFAVGHSVASYDLMQEAIDNGLRQATHIFNGMNPLHHRRPGVVGAVLSDDRVFAQVITDGVHVHPAVVKTLLKAKGVNRTVLITDAIRAAGLGNGEFDLLGQTVTVKDGVARIASGSLAGSILTMDQAVRNTMEFCDISFPEAIQMASLTPAKSLNLEHERGALEPGLRADITIFDQDYSVETTIVGGKIIYKK
ncbi:MAG: N-acetylglucosamine-6-phosphate deacetylase [Anaerolineales bacterium]